MLVNNQTGIPIDRIRLVDGDTDLVPRAADGRIASRCSSAVRRSTWRPRRWSSGPSDSPPTSSRPMPPTSSSMSIPELSASLAFRPARSTWAELARRAGDAPAGVLGDGEVPGILAAEEDFEQADSTFPFGAHIAVVEVDLDTGDGRASFATSAVDDCGTVINPLLVQGQQHGGVAAGHRPGAVRGGSPRRRREPADSEPRRLRHPDAPPSCPASSVALDRDAVAAQPVGRQGDRRGRRRSARRLRCRTPSSTPSPTSACATSTCRARRSASGGRSETPRRARCPIPGASHRRSSPACAPVRPSTRRASAPPRASAQRRQWRALGEVEREHRAVGPRQRRLGRQRRRPLHRATAGSP